MSTETLAAAEWPPSPRLDAILRFFVKGLGVVGWVAMFLLFAGASEHSFLAGVGPFFGWVLAFAAGFVAVFMHELGHAVAARAMGMHLVWLYCGPLQVMAQRHGFRWRWKRRKAQKNVPAAAVFAVPRMGRPFAPQLCWMAAGGPLMNLALGALSFALWDVYRDDALGGYALGFALFNLALGVGNLVPSKVTSGTDGFRILRAMRTPESDPSLAFMRFNSLAYSGTTADKLPPAVLESIRSLPDIGPLLHLWAVLKGMQNQSRWREAEDLRAELDRVVVELTEDMRKACGELVAFMHCEIRFSALLAERCGEVSPLDALTPESDWISPSVRPRCQAAMAAAAGDHEATTRWLAASEQLASRSNDASHRACEERLRAAVLRLLETSPDPQAQGC